jgi:alpha-1,2-mannosyltransferase
MASSAGVFCAVALLVCWFVALRLDALAPGLDLVPELGHASRPAAERDVQAAAPSYSSSAS